MFRGFFANIWERRSYRKLIDQLHITLNQIENFRVGLDNLGNLHFQRIVNLIHYILVLQFDISALYHGILESTESWELRLYSRLLGLTLVEYMEDLGHMLGRDLTCDLVALSVSIEDQEVIKRFRSDLYLIRYKHEQTLRRIRNIASAHRDHNALEQIRIIRSIDSSEIIEITRAFYRLNSPLIMKLMEILSYSFAKFAGCPA